MGVGAWTCSSVSGEVDEKTATYIHTSVFQCIEIQDRLVMQPILFSDHYLTGREIGE